MTGWQIVGIVPLAVFVLGCMIAMATIDFAGCLFAWGGALVVVLSLLLATGAWTP